MSPIEIFFFGLIPTILCAVFLILTLIEFKKMDRLDEQGRTKPEYREDG